MDRIQPDGGVTLRPGTPDDEAGLAAMLRLLSRDAAFMRFLIGFGEPKAWLVRGLLATGSDRGAVLAVLPGGTVVGHACWSVRAEATGEGGRPPATPPGSAGVCDVGVVVLDGWQRRGIGAALVEAAVTHAAAAGGTVLHLDVHPENRRLLASLRRRLPTANRWFADGLVTVEAPLAELLRPARPEPVADRSGAAVTLASTG